MKGINKKTLNKAVDWLVIIGAINVGLSQLGYNVVAMIGQGFAPIIYGAVGVAGVYLALKKLNIIK